MQPKNDVPFSEVAAFHGHVCPGLAMGYRMAQSALQHLAGIGAANEDLVAVVENDACGVDARQCLTRARVRDSQVACIPCAGAVEDGKGV